MNIPTSDLVGNPIVRTHSATITRAGGVVRDPESGLAVTFLPDSVLEPVTATITITARQLSSVIRDGYDHSPNGMVLSFDASKLSQAPRIEISLPTNAFGRNGVLCVADPAGGHWPLPTPHRKGSSRRAGMLPVGFFLRGKERAVPSDADYSLRIFTATSVPSAEITSLITYTAIFDPISQSWKRTIPSLTGKRVAVVVHGLLSSLDDLIVLASTLATYTAPGGAGNYYDAVIGFNYTSTAPISEIGSALLASVGPMIANASAADLVAHSMGNLVSRWAMEVGKGGQRLGTIGHYISLGGPHAGVPFGASWIINEFLYLFHPSFRPCLLDLLTQGFQGTPNTSFLPSINTKTPNPSGTRYYSLAGTDWEWYEPPMGETTFGFYVETCGYSLSSEDGLVATWSAQNPILKWKDPQWNLQPWATQYWTHSELHAAPTALNAIRTFINSWAATAGSDTLASDATVEEGTWMVSGKRLASDE